MAAQCQWETRGLVYIRSIRGHSRSSEFLRRKSAQASATLLTAIKMDLLKAEINRKRKVADTLSESSGRSGFIGTSRFMRQSDIIKSQEKELEESQRKLDEEKEGKANIRRLEEEKQLLLKLSKVPTAAGSAIIDTDKLSILTDDQVKQRLRSLFQPIILFGEKIDDRLARLIAYQSDDRNNNEDDYRNNSASGKGRQLLSQQKADDLEEEEFEEEDRAEEREGREPRRSHSTSAADDSDDEDDKKYESSVGPATGYIVNGKRIQFSKIPNLSADKIVYKYFRSLLKEWEWDLNARDDTEKITSKGKMDTKTQKQCKDYIRPLFKLCKRKQVPADIIDKLLEMVQFCEDGNFRVAHDRYISTAIGNAAWPIGLTMVGIHERSGREKISTSKVAHVMNNELQRKYLTSVKRLMTFAQKKRPDVPPSMKVL